MKNLTILIPDGNLPGLEATLFWLSRQATEGFLFEVIISGDANRAAMIRKYASAFYYQTFIDSPITPSVIKTDVVLKITPGVITWNKSVERMCRQASTHIWAGNYVLSPYLYSLPPEATLKLDKQLANLTENMLFDVMNNPVNGFPVIYLTDKETYVNISTGEADKNELEHDYCPDALCLQQTLVSPYSIKEVA